MKKFEFLRSCFRCLFMTFGLAPRQMSLYTSVNIFHSMLGIVMTLVLQSFFDAAAEYALHKLTLLDILSIVLLIGIVYLIYHILDGLVDCFAELTVIKMEKNLQIKVIKKISSLRPIEFEKTKRLEDMEKAVQGSQQVQGIALTTLDTFTYYIVYLVIIGGYLFMMEPILSLSLVILFIPCIISKFLSASMFKKMEDQQAPIRRELDYYKECLTAKTYLKETRLLGANSFFYKRYERMLRLHSQREYEVHIRKNLLQLLMDLLTAIGFGMVIWLLFCSVMKQSITIGVFAAVLTSLNKIFRYMNRILDRMGWASESIGAAQNFIKLLDEPEPKEVTGMEKPQSISVENVSFSYPESERAVLRNVNITIPFGQTIAIVGENGSGKTTLSRLLTGVYTPTSGQVLYGERPMSDQRYRGISAVFQNYNRYWMSVWDNIAVSEMEQKRSKKDVEKLCADSGVEIEDCELYPDGLETLMGREYDGAEVSGGQWQRIAIARGLYRQSHIMVLDEPTAAIDPLEETKLYQSFAEACRNKTAFLITHRLGSAKLADRILVLKDGELVQDGTHDTLVDIPGEYQRLYDAQRQWYES